MKKGAGKGKGKVELGSSETLGSPSKIEKSGSDLTMKSADSDDDLNFSDLDDKGIRIFEFIALSV